jgi:hypothetical protein
MVTHFITALDGVITGQHCGDINADFSGTPYHGHERIIIPQGVMVLHGDRYNFYDDDWKRKPNIQLIEEELMPMPEGYVREGDELRPMTAEERIIAGIDPPQPSYKVEGGEIVEMTLSEQLEMGQITQADIDQKTIDANKKELNRRLAELQTPEALAQAEIDENYAAWRKARLIALLAVKQQSRWPYVVDWPEE